MYERSFTHNGKVIEIHLDEDTEFANPRNNDNLGTMACFHRRYQLGDKISLDADHFRDWLKRERLPVVLDLYLYDHGGISMQASEHGNPFSCQWDSGQVGVIYVNRQRIFDSFHAKHRPRKKHEQVFHAMTNCPPARRRLTPALIAKAKACLLAEVEEYDRYLRGEVFGYVLKSQAGKELDSCWGFIGHDYVVEAAKQAAS
jgi:hypothetical protein